MKNLTLWTLGLIATLSFFAGLPGPRATADPFGVGPPNAGWFADNANHSWCTLRLLCVHVVQSDQR